MRKLRRIIPWILAVAILVTSAALLVRTYNQQRTEQTIPEQVAVKLGKGASEGFSGAVSAVKDFFTWLFDWRTLARENREYSNKMAEIAAENDLLRSQAREYSELLTLANRETFKGLETVTARVISTEPGSWLREFTVNRGSKDGIAVDMVVVNEKGLVGRVFSVTEETAEIMTIVDPRSSVCVYLDRSDDEGIMKGTQEASATEPVCSVEYLPFNADIVPGDRILTSDLGGVYPRGLTVGTVIEASSSGSSRYAVVRSDVDFAHLDYVLILTGEEK